jgi:hypothetical protein
MSVATACFHNGASPHVQDLGSEPVCPVGSKNLDQRSDDHEDLNSPESGLTAKTVDGPITDKQNNDESARVSA